MTKLEEKFIPLHTLIRTKAKTLSPRQRELIELHRQAKRDRDALDIVANAITKESLLASGGKAAEAFNEVSNVSDRTTSSALSAAVKYYDHHGKAEQAFDQLRKFADRHWSAPIDWTEAFREYARRHGVMFTPGLLKRINRYEDKMDAASFKAKQAVASNKAKSGGGLN